MGIFNFFKKEDSVKKQKKQYLANLFYLAISDGEIHELEQKKINEIREGMGVTESEYNDLVSSIMDGSYAKKNNEIMSPSSDDEAWEHLQDLAVLASLDGKIDDNEIEVLKGISDAMGYDQNNKLINGLEAVKETFNSTDVNVKEIKEKFDAILEEDEKRINWEEMEDVGIITHYKGKPFTGIAFSLHENGNVAEEMEMLDGLKHGEQVLYNEDSSVDEVSCYENDLRIGHDENTYCKKINELFEDDKYDLKEFLIKINLLIFLYKSEDEGRDIKQYSESYYDSLTSGLTKSMRRLNKFSAKAMKEIYEDDVTLQTDNFATEETSQSSFAKGWILNEMKSAFLFTTLSTSDALKVNFGVDDLRRATIIEFIQMCYKNTYQINSIENNLEWRNFIHNALNEKLTKDVLSVLMDMQFNKKLELLFLLKTLTNATIELVKKSGKNNEEMNSIISHMNDILSNTEKMFKIFPSKAEYDDVYNKYCDEDDRQRQEM